MNRMKEGPLPEIRIRNVKRDELQCDLCPWTWLVPEHEGVWAVAQVANLHWEENHALVNP